MRNGVYAGPVTEGKTDATRCSPPSSRRRRERGQRVQARALERVGPRAVGDEDDYRHAIREGDDMRRRKASRS